LTSIGGDLWIIGNDSLISLTGLDNVLSIGGDLTIRGNDTLTSLTGLDNVTSIGGDLTIGYNYALTSLISLDGLTSIGGDLSIIRNDSLISLTGLDNIDAASINNLHITNNSHLSTCEVQSVCDYLANQGDTIEIYNNATGCNLQEEVEEACTSGLDDISNLNNHITIYPNPSSTHITIELPTTPHKNTSLTIYNLNGQQLITQPITEPQTMVDVSGLPSGVYFVKVADDEKVMMGKLIKQ